MSDNRQNEIFSGRQEKGEKTVFPLSYGQEGLWFIDQLTPGNYIYNLPYAYRIRREIHIDLLKDSFKAVLERHPVLCARFLVRDQKPVQEIQSPDYLLFEHEKIEYRSEPELIKLLVAKARQPFDLEKDPLLRAHLVSMAEDDHVLLINIHHIVFDGSSLIVLLRELIHFYLVKVTGLQKTLDPVSGSYADFVEWQRTMVNGDEGRQHRDYWMQKLSGELPSLSMLYDRPKNNMKTADGKSFTIGLPGDAINKVRTICQKAGITSFVFMLSVFKVFLFRYTNLQDIIVGTAVHGRSNIRFNPLIGYFMNMIVIRSAVSGEMKFPEFLQQVNSNSLEAFSHCDYPFPEIVRQMRDLKNRGFSPLMQVAFIFQNWFTGEQQFSATGEESASLDFDLLESVPEIHQEGEFDLALEIIKTRNDYNAIFKYDSGLFDSSTIERMAHHYVRLLNDIVSDMSRNISEFDVASSSEREMILKTFNNTEKMYPVKKCVQLLFEEQVKLKPDNTALIFGGERLSYSELNRKANRLSRVLRQKGLGCNDIAAIVTERSFEMMIGIFAIIKAGGAYLPVAPSYPKERIEYILENSKAKLVLVPDKSKVNFDSAVEIIELTDQGNYAPDDSDPECLNKPTDLAYVIYTSGTTGNPKGAMIEHHSLVNRLKWMQDAYPLSENDTILQKTPYTFDVSVWELFWWSFEGAKLCLLKPQAEKYPEEIVAAIEKNSITVMHFVPSMLSVFLDYVKSFSALDRIASLKQVFASGEALTVTQVNLFNQLLLKRNSTKLMNLYGPTEATIDVSYFDCSTREVFDLIPIGKPISNIKLLIIDKYNKLQPVGLPGELCIAGVGLARGYLNNPKITNEKFVENPFDPPENPFEPATLMYKTGDLAKWLPDGNIEYLGRIDRQTKIRGFRIELDEIEEALNKYDNILRSLVVLDDKKDFLDNQQLKAFIITRDNKDISRKEVKDFLMQKLPEYMVPASFERVETIPLTAHGKVDYKALMNLVSGQPAEAQSETGQNTGMAEKERIKAIVGSIYRQALDRADVDPNTNFFDLGGHSLLMIKIGIMLKEQLEMDISTVELFQYPSIESLSQYLCAKTEDASFEQSQKRGKTRRDMFMSLKKNK